MSARANPAAFDWGAWVRSFGVWALGLIGVLVAFYFTTKFTLDKHEAQFVEVGKQFDRFNNTLQKNYQDWATLTKAEQDKAEKNAKDDRDARERMREQFMLLFTQLQTNSAGTKAQVDAIVKQLDGVTGKIDNFQRAPQVGTGAIRR